MNILDTIIRQKQKEVQERQQKMPLTALQQLPAYTRPVHSLKDSLKDAGKTGIIAEFKRRSPSKGIINSTAVVKEVTEAYTRYGASGLSVLTDSEFFGGTTADLQEARHNAIPVLRKDFIIDPWQVHESRAMGADVILLIAACLSRTDLKELALLAVETGMEVLLEIHTEEECGHICEATTLVGVNNRNLKTFEVDTARSIAIGQSLPATVTRIAESGIDSLKTFRQLRDAGFSGFLMGEHFMKEADPGSAFKNFVAPLFNGAQDLTI